MHDVNHVTPLWYAVTMNATTNTPRTPCLDAVIIDIGSAKQDDVVCRLDMYRTKVLIYPTMVLMARVRPRSDARRVREPDC
jgi:hypothetical protein